MRLLSGIKIRHLFSPAVLVLAPIAIQYASWLYGYSIGFEFIRFDPQQGTDVHNLFAVYVIATVLGVMIGNLIPVRETKQPLEPSFRCLRRVMILQFVLLVASSALYARAGIDIEAFDTGINIAQLSYTAREDTIPGVTSFTFICMTLVPLCVYYLARYSFDYFVVVIFGFSFVILLSLALLFSGRIYFIYPFFAGLFAYVIFSMRAGTAISLRAALGLSILALTTLFAVFAFMEYFRSWQVIRDYSDVDFLTYMAELFFGGYLAQNHDNALAFLDIPPGYTLLASSPALARIAELMGSADIRRTAIFNIDFGEGHNTVVIFGVLYQDLGLFFSLLVIVALVAFSQRLFRLTTSSYNIGAILLYAVFVPHLISMCRINAFGTVSFIVGLVGWALLRLCGFRRAGLTARFAA